MNQNIFFDRKDYLDLLEKRVTDLKDGYRQNIAIIGDELVGKTSLVFKLLDNFCDNRFLMLYVEARPETLESFVKRFIGILLYNFLANSGIILKEDIHYLINRSEGYIPETTKKIKIILSAVEKRKRNGILTELFSLCESLNLETGKFCVVILDEFLNLENLGFNNLYRDWSKLLITQKKTMYIIISSMKFKTKTVLSKNLSLLFGNFEVITVYPFDIKVSEGYLQQKLQGFDLASGLRDFLVHFTGGFPLYLEVITDALLKSNQSALSEILESLLFDAPGILNQRFSNYMKRFLDASNSNDYISILYLISSGRNKIKDIAHILKKQKKDLMTRVNRLLELDTVTRNGDFLQINDRVFSFWLRFVYQERMNSLTFDARNQKTKFRDKIEDMVGEFLLQAQKPLIERMNELFRLFADEIIQIERKKIRLSHFREIKPMEFKGRNLTNGLIGRSSDSLWIVAVKDEHLTEEDITEFAKECKKYRHKQQRKIIVSLKDINMNTRLKAMEEKIWAWDINNLNQICDAYFKPWVIA